MTLLTTEEWIAAYLKAEDVALYLPKGDQRLPPDVRVMLALIHSIHDLQQQITELREAVGE